MHAVGSNGCRAPARRGWTYTPLVDSTLDHALVRETRDAQRERHRADELEGERDRLADELAGLRKGLAALTPDPD